MFEGLSGRTVHRDAGKAEHDQAALLLLLDAFCRQAYSNARRSEALLRPLEHIIANPHHALGRKHDINRLCDPAEAWVRDRYEQQRADAVAARRLADIEEREEIRLKNLINAITQLRQITQGGGS